MYVPATTKRKHLRQQGFALLEVALAMVLLAALAGKVLFDDYEKIQTLKFEAQGHALKTLQAAHNNYIVTYYDKLASGVPIVGSDDLTVTVAQLAALNVGLPPGFSDKAIIGGRYRTAIVLTPAGCPAGACQMEGLVWIDTPRLKHGKADSPALGLIARTVGPDAAYSSFEAPSLLEGLNWTTTNPEGSKVGIIGVRTGYNSSGMAQFLRRDGTLPMTGALNMGGQNIGNAKDITATTRITSAGQIKAAGRIITDEYVQINGVAVAGNACSPNGLIGRDAAGLTLSCQSGVWAAGSNSCPIWAGNLNWLVIPAGTSSCVNGAGLGNAPTGDWFFIESNRHANAANYYVSQRAVGMTGEAAGLTWTRSQQSNSAGSGWSNWKKLGGSGGGYLENSTGSPFTYACLAPNNLTNACSCPDGFFPNVVSWGYDPGAARKYSRGAICIN